jgi:hypothetical protein
MICSSGESCSIEFIAAAPQSIGLLYQIDSWLCGVWLPWIRSAFGC